MIDIDLLPPEYAPKKLVSPGNIAIISLAFLIILSLLLSSSRLLAARRDYSTRVIHLDNKIEQYKPLADAVHQLRSRIRELSPRLSLAKDLLEGRTSWSDKLVELHRCLPQYGIWIDEVVIKREKVEQPKLPRGMPKPAGPESVAGPIIVDILGSVVSVEKVSQFVGNLEESDIFGNVIFDSAKSGVVGIGNESFISFRLTVEILSLGIE